MNQEILKKLGVTPGKAVLVGVLACIFAGVLWAQLGGQDSPPSQKSKKRRIRQADQTKDKDNPTEEKSLTNLDIDPVVWPNMKLKNVVAFDPFATPDSWNAQGHDEKKEPDQEDSHDEKKKQVAQARKQLESKMLQLEKQGVNMVLMSGEQRLAIIGNKSLQIGDVYQGLRVIAIDSDGVVVVPIDSAIAH